MAVAASSAEHRELVEEIRRAVAERVRGTSLRSVARQVGFSPSGLQKFISGTQPYSPGFRRLHAWYLANSTTPPDLDESDAAAALTLLTIGMPESERTKAAPVILATLRGGFGPKPPQWLMKMLERTQDT